MHAFSYWHTYFDSTFLAYPPKIAHSFYQEQAFWYSRLNISEKDNSKWPKSQKLQALSNIYFIFELFIKSSANWVDSMCDYIEIKMIEKRLNQLLIRLQCEKKYAQQFWSFDQRRIQASVVHFYLLIKQMIYSILPQNCTNLKIATQKEMLCLKIANLQNFINKVLQNMNQIYHFMVKDSFKEQQSLAKEFFSQFKDFTQTLPFWSKQKLLRIPKIMKYICVNNSIEASIESTTSLADEVRKKQQIKKQKMQQKFSLKSQGSNNFDFQVKNTFNLVEIRDENYFTNLNRSTEKQISVPKQLNVFKFSEKIRKNSIVKRSKAITNEKMQQVMPSRKNRLSTLSPVRNIRLKTLFHETNTASATTNLRKRQQTVQSSLTKKTLQSIGQFIDENEQERDVRLIKKRQGYKQRTLDKLSDKINLNQGKCKGWGLVREYLGKRIIQRKLRKIIQG